MFRFHQNSLRPNSVSQYSRGSVADLAVFCCRKVALVIILTRAGLDLDPNALKRLKVTVPKLGLIPWAVEAIVVATLTKYLLGLPWVWGFLLGSVIAAVSPAVVVPCLFRLRAKGYGVAKVRLNDHFKHFQRSCVFSRDQPTPQLLAQLLLTKASFHLGTIRP